MSAGTLTVEEFRTRCPEARRAEAGMVEAFVAQANRQVDTTAWGSEDDANDGAYLFAYYLLARSDFGVKAKWNAAQALADFRAARDAHVIGVAT